MIGAEHGITPSGLVYLFGAQFVEPAKLTGETLLYGGTKVKSRELAELLYGVAFLSLSVDGHVRLDLAQRKRLFGHAQAVVATPLDRPVPGTGIEAIILSQLSGNPAKDGVADVLGRLIGRDMADPWGYGTALVKQDLARRGFLLEQREARHGLGKVLGDKVTLSAVPERIAPLADLVGLVRGLLANAQARQPQLVSQLWRDLRAGFESRVERQDDSGTD